MMSIRAQLVSTSSELTLTFSVNCNEILLAACTKNYISVFRTFDKFTSHRQVIAVLPNIIQIEKNALI